MDPSTLSPPNSASSTSTKKSRFFLPLSNHGMPKTPAPISPGGSIKSNRFNFLKPSSPRSIMSTSTPNSPRSITSGQMSPPMSAKSFATLIDDEAPFSPNAMRKMTHLDGVFADQNLHSNGSTLVSTTPIIPPIPKFDDIEIVHANRRHSKHLARSARSTPNVSPRNSPGLAPYSPPLASLNERVREKENVPPKVEEVRLVEKEPVKEVEAEKKEDEVTALPQPLASPTGLGLGRLTSRMKSVLRPKKAANKKVEKVGKERRVRDSLDRMEDVHWTEM